MEIIYQALDNLKERLGEVNHLEVLLHLDRGVHLYTPRSSEMCKRSGNHIIYVP